MPRELFVKKSCFLNEFLAENLNISKTKAKQLLNDRLVFVNKRRTWIASFRLKPGDRIELTGAVIQPPQNNTRKISILYEDEQYLVANKFPGILTNGEKSFETLLRKQRKEEDLTAVHRLDKDTSGLVIFAKQQEFFVKIKELFQTQRVRKIYRALAVGAVAPQRFIIDTPLAGQKAFTGVHVLRNNHLASYLELSLVTGRTHQIRLHLQKIGHPLVGEKLYVQNPIKDITLRQAPRQMLHAWQIEFNNPYTNKNIIATEKEPEDFREMLKRLKILSGTNI